MCVCVCVFSCCKLPGWEMWGGLISPDTVPRFSLVLFVPARYMTGLIAGAGSMVFGHIRWLWRLTFWFNWLLWNMQNVDEVSFSVKCSLRIRADHSWIHRNSAKTGLTVLWPQTWFMWTKKLSLEAGGKKIKKSTLSQTTVELWFISLAPIHI